MDLDGQANVSLLDESNYQPYRRAGRLTDPVAYYQAKFGAKDIFRFIITHPDLKKHARFPLWCRSGEGRSQSIQRFQSRSRLPENRKEFKESGIPPMLHVLPACPQRSIARQRADKKRTNSERSRTVQTCAKGIVTTATRRCSSLKSDTLLSSKVVAGVGFEPTTNRLTADRSTAELLRKL